MVSIGKIYFPSSIVRRHFLGNQLRIKVNLIFGFRTVLEFREVLDPRIIGETTVRDLNGTSEWDYPVLLDKGKEVVQSL